MKVKVHLRVGYDKRRRRSQIAANVKPSLNALIDNRGVVLPTVSFAVMLDIPEAMFTQAEQVIATLTVPESAAQIAAEVKL